MAGKKRKRHSDQDQENIPDNTTNIEMNKKTSKLMLEITKVVLGSDALRAAADYLQKFEHKQTDKVDDGKESDLYQSILPRSRACKTASNTKSNIAEHSTLQNIIELDNESEDDFRTSSTNPNNKIYTCLKCPFVCTESKSLVLHQVVHISQKPYICNVCGFQASDNKNNRFNIHVLNHYSDKPQWCHLCDTYFVANSNLYQHLKTQHPTASIQCEKCNFSTYLQDAMKKHIDFYHSRDETCPLLKCQECTFVAGKVISLQMHQTVLHDTKKPYHCNLCDYKSSCSSNTNFHILSHHNDRPFACPHCSYNTYTISCVNKHIKLKHTFSIIRCDQCDFIAFLASTMIQHKEIHHSEKLKILKCTNSKCTFLATKEASLELHKVVHITKPPFQCGICQYKSARSDRLNNHILGHNHDKPFICPHCSMQYGTIGILYTHIKLRHSHLGLHCDKCDFTTPFPTMMTKHQGQYHSNRSTVMDLIRCEKCTFICTKPESLTLHNIIHTSKKPFRCTECQYKTHCSSNFSCHVLSHYSDKPYSCPHCPKTAGQYVLIKRHIKSYHPDQ